MNSASDLFLHEQILLLALRDKEGTIGFDVDWQHPIAGAIVAELLLNKRVRVDGSKRRKPVTVVDFTPLGDPIIDECLEKIKKMRIQPSIEALVSKFSDVRKLKHRLAQQLCRKGILKADEDTVLGLFKRKIYPEINPEPERKLIEQMREAIFTDKDDIDSRTVVLISLAQSAGLLTMVFDKKELKQRKGRIKQLINGEIVGKATKEAIEAMHAAVAIACFVPIMAATAVNH